MVGATVVYAPFHVFTLAETSWDPPSSVPPVRGNPLHLAEKPEAKAKELEARSEAPSALVAFRYPYPNLASSLGWFLGHLKNRHRSPIS